MMYGILLLSLVHLKEGSFFKSAFVYAILLNFKHIFLYLAPCFGIIYLKQVVFNQTSIGKALKNFTLLGLQTISVFAVSYGPFIYVGGVGQLQQIASRLFPFQRGLVHEYLAANFWAVWVSIKRLVSVSFYSNLFIDESRDDWRRGKWHHRGRYSNQQDALICGYPHLLDCKAFSN